MDIDLGIRVSSWNQFDQLINTLELSGEFKKLKEKHRVIYKDIIIDIVPFGGISDKNEKISWPSENEVVMSVMGFNEVYDNSTLVRLQNRAFFVDFLIFSIKIDTESEIYIRKGNNYEKL